MRQDKSGLILIALGLTLFVLALYFDPASTSKSQSSQTQDQPIQLKSEHLQKLDYELKRGHIESEHKQIEQETDNQEARSEVTFDNTPREDREVLPLATAPEVNSSVEEIKMGAPEAQKFRKNSPESRISKKLERDKWVEDYERKVEDAYVDQFIENAEKQGLGVEVNEDLEVIDIRRVPTNKPLLFQQGDGE